MKPPVSPDASAIARGGEAAGIASDAGDLHRLLVESVQDYAIFALDPGGHILSWNPGAQRFKGYTEEEILGRHFSIFYPDADREAGKPEWELAEAAAHGRLEDEGWRIRKDGTRFWANVVITALRGPGGVLMGYAKVTRDLTARRRAEDRLRASEERFRVLVQGVKDYAIFMLDPAGYITSWNDGAQRIKGYSAHEIIGRHFSTFYTAEDLADGKPPRELEIATRTGKYEEEGWRVRKDGSQFWANVLITALRSDAGDLIGFAKVTRDLTERRAAMERALANERRLALAEAANRAKSGFLAAMSHELRTPLNAIGGYAQILEMGLRGPLTDQQRTDLARIRSSQQYLLGLINDILNFSRIEAGKVSYDIVPVALHEIVESVIQMIAPQAASKGIGLECAACPPDVIALADRLKVEQIVLNLLSNAVKFTSSGLVAVTCGAEGARATLTIRDTGIGIPADRLADVFEPFVQVGRDLTHHTEGAGLGLSISRDLARAMGGDLTAESEVGVGSAFTLTLPRG